MRVFAGVCMLLGCFLGAGFISGREIASYFSKFGNQSIWGVVIATILLFIFTLFFLILSNKTNSFDKFSRYYFGKCDKVANIFMAICVLIISSSMFAGTISLAETFNVNKFLFVIITFILSFLIVKGNINSLSRLNIIIMPLILIVVIVATNTSELARTFDSSVILSIASGSNYIFINIVSLGLFLLEIGYKYTRKEKLLIALISSIIIAVMLFLINNAILCENYIYDVFPNLSMSINNPLLYVLMQISIFFGLFTTLISNVFILSNYINKLIKNYQVSILLSLTSSLLLSFFGFATIVGYIYWFIGLVGVIMIFSVLIKKSPAKEGEN